MLQRIMCVCLGLLGLAGLKLLGDCLSHRLNLRVPGSFLGFLVLLALLSLMRRVPRALSEASSFLMNHLTLFLLPSLVAAAAAFEQVSHATNLLLVSGLVVTMLMVAVGGRVSSALGCKREVADDV